MSGMAGDARGTTARVARAAAWILMAIGLLVVAANPGVPSLGYAMAWLAILAIGRAITFIVAWSALAIDLALIVVCVVGLEIGGLILIPSLLAFAVADGLGP
jgi:hypothetical protein